MPAYLIVAGTVTDEARWTAYRRAVLPLIERFGGRHLNAPDGKRLEGEDDRVVALFGFDTMEQIQRFWDSPDYVPIKALREGAATLDVRAVPGAR